MSKNEIYMEFEEIFVEMNIDVILKEIEQNLGSWKMSEFFEYIDVYHNIMCNSIDCLLEYMSSIEIFDELFNVYDSDTLEELLYDIKNVFDID